jgi:hypothetical protein
MFSPIQYIIRKTTNKEEKYETPPLELAMMEVSRTNILTFKSALNVLWLSLKSEEQYETQLSGNEKKKKSLISAQN